MTHVKNAEAFARLVDFCTGYGGTYNPGRSTLQIGTLVTQVSATRMALEQVIITKALYDNEVNKRRQVFDQLPRLVSSILRTLEASGAPPEKLSDARQFAHLLMGISPKKQGSIPVEGAQPVTTQRSRLQLAFVSKADSFAKLMQAVATETLYQSNEAHLSVAGLAEKVQELKDLNQQVSIARVAWSNSRIARNRMMYDSSQSVWQQRARCASMYAPSLVTTVSSMRK
jgi:hypothetical protein